MAYQETPTASKNNAFCWHTYQPEIDWRRTGGELGSAKRTKDVDAKRRAGIEPLFIPGMGSAARHNPMDAARFAIASIQKGGRRA